MAALERFMKVHGEARRDKAHLYVDVSTLFHIARWRLPPSTLALVREAMLRPSVQANARASRAVFFTSKTGVLPSFLRALGSNVREYFNIVFVFEHAGSRCVCANPRCLVVKVYEGLGGRRRNGARVLF